MKLENTYNIVPQNLSAFTSKSSPFGNIGYAWKKQAERAGPWVNVFWSTKVKADYEGEYQTLGDVLEKKFDNKYEIDSARLDEWTYAKGNKNEFRLAKEAS